MKTKEKAMKCDICNTRQPEVDLVNPALSVCYKCYVTLTDIRSLSGAGKDWGLAEIPTVAQWRVRFSARPFYPPSWASPGEVDFMTEEYRVTDLTVDPSDTYPLLPRCAVMTPSGTVEVALGHDRAIVSTSELSGCTDDSLTIHGVQYHVRIDYKLRDGEWTIYGATSYEQSSYIYLSRKDCNFKATISPAAHEGAQGICMAALRAALAEHPELPALGTRCDWLNDRSRALAAKNEAEEKFNAANDAFREVLKSEPS